MIDSTEANRLFAEAQTAYGRHRYDVAATTLERLAKAIGRQAPILHLMGLCQKGMGNYEAAVALLQEAAAQTPQDAQLHSNLGNAMAAAGQTEEAVAHYDRAIALQPEFADAHFNRAVNLHKLERFAEAREEFVWLAERNPENARLWSARGAMEIDAGALPDAKESYLRALNVNPGYAKALAGLAKVTAELAEPEAPAKFRKARMANPEDPELIIGEAYALQAVGEPEATTALEAAVTANPGWIAGQNALATLRWESGDADHYADLYEQSVMSNPQNDALRIALVEFYSQLDMHDRALEITLARPGGVTEHEHFALLSAMLASRSGQEAEADSHFTHCSMESLQSRLHRGKHALRFKRLKEADQWLDKARSMAPRDIFAWAFSDLAWRALADPRHEWLHGQPGLYGTQQLELDDVELSMIADHLRAMHKSRAEPVGQSLRKGTQTRGNIFNYSDPVIGRLREAIWQAVKRHWAQLPPQDDSHPLLSHRFGTPRFTGSWSVRLTDGGFHVQHIHPEGLLSSACYIALPPSVDDGVKKEGWLEIGRNADDLGWNMDALATVQPKVGRLALFPSTLFHGTRPFGAGERMTVAFDVVV